MTTTISFLVFLSLLSEGPILHLKFVFCVNLTLNNVLGTNCYELNNVTKIVPFAIYMVSFVVSLTNTIDLNGFQS